MKRIPASELICQKVMTENWDVILKSTAALGGRRTVDSTFVLCMLAAHMVQAK